MLTYSFDKLFIYCFELFVPKLKNGETLEILINNYFNKYMNYQNITILDKLNINKCHLVGHDRGAVILEYFAINFPNKVLSYSRGSQVWNYIEPEWAKLAPDICVGPPHKIMSVYEQLRVLLFTVIHLKKPLELLSDLFEFKGRNAKRGTDLYDRYTHLKYKSQLSYKRYAKKFRNSLVQGGVYSEVKNRSNLKEKLFPIMQFQGEDEFKYNKSGTLISDQPYFGIYNLYRNEIEDVYPGCVGQDNDKYQSPSNMVIN